MADSSFSITRDVKLPFDQTVSRVTALLAAEGFGVLTTIDVQATFKRKLDVDVAPYTILGACNPGYAHKALQAVEAIGLLLPCNVAVKELSPGHCRVFITNVERVFSLVEAEGMADVAGAVGTHLQRVADGLSSELKD